MKINEKMNGTVETRPLRLVPFEMRTDEEGAVVLIRQDGEIFQIPERCISLLELSRQGCSLADMAIRLRGREQKPFALIASYLGLLYDCGLLLDPAAIRLAEALRSDFSWSESVALEEIYGIEIVRARAGKAGTEWAKFWVLVLMGFSALAIMRAAVAELNFEGSWPRMESAGPILVAFFSTFCFGRSARALAQFIASLFLDKSESSLRLKVDALSPALSTKVESMAQADFLGVFGGVCGSLLAISFLLVPLALANKVTIEGRLEEVRPLIAYFSWVLLLFELSPFRHSAMTDLLRLIYAAFDQKSQEGRAESRIKAVHVSACVVWVVNLGFFIAVSSRNFLPSIWSLSEKIDRTDLRSVCAFVILILIQILVFLSLVDDVVSGVGNGGGEDRLSIRRIWRRRMKRSMSTAPQEAELESLPLLRQMSPAVRKSLLESSGTKIVRCKEGSTICHQGDDDRVLYIVLQGRLGVAKRRTGVRRAPIAILEAGAIFGEVAFFMGEKRSADVYALDDCQLLAIAHQDRFGTVEDAGSDELQLRIWFLQALAGSSVFKDLPSDALDAIAFSGQRREFRAGSKIIAEGEKGDVCYFILQGRAGVTQNFSKIGQMSTGDVFGEIALLNPELLRTATVTAESDLITVAIDGSRFWTLLCAHLPLAIEFEKIARQRLRLDASRAL